MYCVEHFSNYSIAAFAEGFLVFFWPLTAYPLIFFKESNEVGLFFLFYSKNFFLFPLGGDSRYFYLLFLTRFFLFFPIPWILVDIRLVNIYIYIYIVYIYIVPRKGLLMETQTRILDNRLYYTRKIELHRKGKKSRTVRITPILICLCGSEISSTNNGEKSPKWTNWRISEGASHLLKITSIHD